MAGIEIIRLSDAIGAEIRGVDLSRELDPDRVAAITHAWHAHQIVLFHIFAGKFLGNVHQRPDHAHEAQIGPEDGGAVASVDVLAVGVVLAWLALALPSVAAETTMLATASRCIPVRISLKAH